MKKLIVANWKMNPISLREAEGLFSGICKFAPKQNNVEVVICPPFVYLDCLSQLLKAKGYKLKANLGSQDIFWENKGAYTGEISPAMIKNLGAKYVIIGHSERRKYGEESNEIINKKIKFALKNNLKVLFCIGESERDSAGNYLKFLKKEIYEGLHKISKRILKNLFVVYEPIWAISSNKGAKADTADNFLQTSIYIRKILFFKFGRKIAHQIPILYGGSVDAKNVKEFLDEGKADGVLVGRASLKVKSFVELLKSIN